MALEGNQWKMAIAAFHGSPVRCYGYTFDAPAAHTISSSLNPPEDLEVSYVSTSSTTLNTLCVNMAVWFGTEIAPPGSKEGEIE